jgi:hypothetical protein
MKEYFKKSKIYGKYKNEKEKEAAEDEKAREIIVEMGAMKAKYMDLMKKYGFVLAQVQKQNDVA